MNFSSSKIRGDTAFVLVLGVVFGIGFLSNAIFAFDDMYFLKKLPDLISHRGYFGAAGDLFLGADLNYEYRTYGISRLFHYCAFLLFGAHVYGYALIILLTQIVAALVLLRVAEYHGLSIGAGLCLAVAWLFSPFSINWSFHHYSYAILPFQVLFVTYYFLVVAERVSIAVPVCCGIACALTGELQLAAVPLVMGMAVYERRRQGHGFGHVVIAASAFTASLVAHRLFWSSILRDDTLAPRFIFHYPSLGEFGRRIFLTLQSITDSIAGQLHSSTRSGYLAGFIFSVIVAGLLSLFFARRKDAMDVDPYRAQRLCVLLLGIGFLSIGTYVALSVLSGQISGIMPRRYGFGSLSMLTVGGVCVGFVLLRAGHRVYAFAITVAATTFTGQALISEVPFVRSIDRTVMDTLQEKLSSANSVGKGVYFFVGSDVAYEAADAVSSTRGPLMDELPAMDFFQSPLYLYWTAQHYVQYVLKKPFGAMPISDKGEGTGTPGARPLNVDSGADGVVVANLGLSPLDPAGKNIQIFDSYADFEPNKFSRTIKHEVVGGSRCTNDSFVVDIGSLEATGPGSYVDKEFGADKGRLASWVVDYGYVGVGHAAFEHPDIDSRFFYYKTNRHGSFVYRVVFDSPRYIEASFDFWEQWGRGPGERVFDLDVSWDGERWASVGRIDPASMNGHNAFSIVIVRAKVQSMFFRLVPVRGDVPMLQGLKICRFS